MSDRTLAMVNAAVFALLAVLAFIDGEYVYGVGFGLAMIMALMLGGRLQ
jgi:hypothetical protein